MSDQNLLLREDGYPHLNTDKCENINIIYDKPRGHRPADGFCGMCPSPVPHDMGNKFYCSWGCASLAFAHYQELKHGSEE